MSIVTCSICGASVAMRISRNGFLQRRVLTAIGFFPWKCGSCGGIFFCRQRADKVPSAPANAAARSTNRSARP